MDWIVENTQWVFSGIGVLALTVIFKIFGKKDNKENSSGNSSVANSGDGVSNIGSNAVSNNIYIGKDENPIAAPSVGFIGLDGLKTTKRILFIDDDPKFKVVKILKSSGWIYTSHIKDAKTLSDKEILEADLIFIDIQGVGAVLDFRDEGLGLALALKDKYNEKKIVIYSVIEDGNRFHQALRKADSFLSKNADPYEFEKTVEELLSK